MRAVAESLKRLYEQGRISSEQLSERVEKEQLRLRNTTKLLEKSKFWLMSG